MGITKQKILVSKSLADNEMDFVNLPIIKGNKAVGVITDSVEKEDGYELTGIVWVRVESIDNKPVALFVD